MSRFRAALYHLSISFAIFVALTYLVLYVWYPRFFFAIDGGWEGMRILIGVDLVLGPLLTLIVFKAGKPGLKLDLTLIGLFQAACLAAGVYIVYSERPVFFVYYDRHFYSFAADTFKRNGVDPVDYRNFSKRSPAEVYVKLPDDHTEELRIRNDLFKRNIPFWTYAKAYRPLDEDLDDIVKHGVKQETIERDDKQHNLARWLKKYGGSFDDYAFFQIHSRYRDAFLGIRKSDKKLIDIVEVAPAHSWK